MANAAAASVFHTSTPLAAVASKPHYQTVLAALAATYTVFAAASLYVTRFEPLDQVRRLRLTALEMRGGGDPTKLAPGVVWLGLLRNACPIPPPAFLGTVATAGEFCCAVASAPTVTVGLSDTIYGANGWYLVVGNESPALDPVRFLIEVSKSVNQTDSGWIPAGTPQWIFNDVGLVRFLADGVSGPTWDRGAVVRYDMRPSAAWYAAWPGADVVFASAMLGAVAMALRGKYNAAVRVFLGAFVADACLYWSAAAYYSAIGSRSAFALWAYGAGCVFVAAAGALCQRHFFSAILCHGFWLFTLTAINVSSLVFGDTSAMLYTPLVTGVVEMIFGTTVLVLRRHVLQTAARLIEPDLRWYERIWQEILAKPGVERELQDLATAVSFISSTIDVASSSSEAGANILELQGTSDLDQLYAQAAGVDLLLRRKLLIWARASDALLEVLPADTGLVNVKSTTGTMNLSLEAPKIPQAATAASAAIYPAEAEQLHESTEFVAWSDVELDPKLLDRVRWGRLKRIDRATEKVLASLLFTFFFSSHALHSSRAIIAG